ncbi:hypothetical protein FHX08_004565 [Rhizobium sp. BK529]|nr:hypothetical protein [Rhizobium sp. BK529]TCS01618.1 hypothetical protein EV281_106363 [Rhizobium sp. BK418]
MLHKVRGYFVPTTGVKQRPKARREDLKDRDALQRSSFADQPPIAGMLGRNITLS